MTQTRFLCSQHKFFTLCGGYAYCQDPFEGTGWRVEPHLVEGVDAATGKLKDQEYFALARCSLAPSHQFRRRLQCFRGIRYIGTKLEDRVLESHLDRISRNSRDVHDDVVGLVARGGGGRVVLAFEFGREGSADVIG